MDVCGSARSARLSVASHSAQIASRIDPAAAILTQRGGEHIDRTDVTVRGAGKQ